MTYDFDLIVLGAGSGGMSIAGEASKLGAKVAVVESSIMGGTCVNHGCVPKKIMWFASELAESFERCEELGFQRRYPSLDWATLVEKRQAYIENARLSYQKKLKKLNIQLIEGQAQLIASESIEVNGITYKAPHIVIATGSTPNIPNVPGADLGITSEGFFALKAPPRRVAIIGAGYIALEFAGMLQAFGAETHLLIRHQDVLRKFDPFLSRYAKDSLLKQGIFLHTQYEVESLEKQPNGQIKATSLHDEVLHDLDCVIWAIGRRPHTETLNLESMRIDCEDNGLIKTDKHHNTSIPGIYAIGDVTTNPHLTPVAIRAGKRLANQLFSGKKTLDLNEDHVPSVIFAHPPLGSIGLSESKAIEKFGKDTIKIYESQFTPMMESFMKEPRLFAIKLITQGYDEQVIGCHIAGPGADEILQGFAVAVQMKATKADFDNTIAIHPTSSEELVLLSKTHLKEEDKVS